MARTPKLKVEISATDHLSKELRGISARVSRSLHVMRSAGAGAAKALGIGLAAAGAGAYAAYKAIKSYSDAADDLSETSKKTGFAISDLQELGFAAKRSGAEFEAFAGMMQTFGKNLGNLASGKGKLAGFLKVVGPDLLKQLQGAGSPAEAFDIITSAIEKLPDPARRAALATKAFGDQGMILLDMLANGRAGLRETRAEFHRYGRTLSQIEGSQAEDFNDSVDNIWTSLSGLRDEIGSRLIPVLTPMANELAAAISDKRADVAERVKDSVEGLATWLHEIDWSAVAGGLGEFASAAESVASALSDVVGNLDIIMDRTGAIESRFQKERDPVAKAALARADAGAKSLLSEPQTVDEALAQATTARRGVTGHVGAIGGPVSDEVGIGTLALRQIGEWMLPNRGAMGEARDFAGRIEVVVKGDASKVTASTDTPSIKFSLNRPPTGMNGR